jgi:hypothetical protein
VHRTTPKPAEESILNVPYLRAIRVSRLLMTYLTKCETGPGQIYRVKIPTFPQSPKETRAARISRQFMTENIYDEATATNQIREDLPRRRKRTAHGLPRVGEAGTVRQPSSDQRLHSEFSIGFSVKNRQQLARPARSHKIVHLLLRAGKLIEALCIDHYDRE